VSGQPNDKPRSEERLLLDKIERCLRSEDGLVLINHIHHNLQQVQRQLNTARDPVDVHRYQGKIDAYETILKLREEKLL
jgi:hypothetical protein